MFSLVDYRLVSNTCTFIIEKFNMNFSKKYSLSSIVIKCNRRLKKHILRDLEGSGVGEVSLFLDSVSEAGRVKSDLKLIY